MKIAMFSAKGYDSDHFDLANAQYGYQIDYFDVRLDRKTSRLAHGYPVVCAFVNDDISRAVLTDLANNGTKLLAMRCAGYNNVDLQAAKELGIKVLRVPAYSPEATAEHAVGMMMALNRRIHKAYQRTRDANFSLEGLVGFNMHGRTAGIIGTGKIGVSPPCASSTASACVCWSMIPTRIQQRWSWAPSMWISTPCSNNRMSSACTAPCSRRTTTCWAPRPLPR